ncbi:MAG TPA: hypothetical protein VFK52_09160 [Nocardioidaceae bacterium]|nr:hypothetical protein [Nocardioidaceae bacterium]
MDKTTLARTGIAGAVAGLGLAVGGVALASADSAASPETAVTTAFGDRPLVRDHIAEVLAEELGLEEAVVEEALHAVRDELRPEEPDLSDGTFPEPPTEEEVAERQAAFAKALADELGVSEAKVTAALDVLREEAEARGAEVRAELRDRLVERLDAAVEDGTLTAADKASVLKAYDADLIGPLGGGFVMGFGGPHGHHGMGGVALGESPNT